MKEVLVKRRNHLFLVLAAAFITNVILAEIIGAKIFSLEKTIGIEPSDMLLFGLVPLQFNLTAGVLIWPFVFITTDIINEYFGPKGVRRISYITAIMVLYAFLIIFMCIKVAPADFWIQLYQKKGVININDSFSLIFGQGMNIIIGSLVAFLVGQLLDAWAFNWIKKFTGNKHLWLRATGSTLISQLVDSFVVLFVAFYIGADWPLGIVLAIGCINYIYKFLIAILITPLLYLAHGLIDTYLGLNESKD